MTKSEKEEVARLTQILDGAVGRLLVPSMKDKLVSEAMKQVMEVSSELCDLL